MSERSGIRAAATAAAVTPTREAIARLSPGYFALVMATGIVSIGLRDVGFIVASRVLMWTAIAAYATLLVLYLARAIAFRHEVLADLRNPAAAFAYFTVVAGTDVLGVRLAQEGLHAPAVILFCFGTALWFVFGYVLPWQVLMTRDGQPILARTNGTWFVWAVASQSLAIVMTQWAPLLGAEAARWAGVLAVLAWAVGVILYAVIGVLVLLRIVQFGITPAQFDPSYWVSMGALAIAVGAGAGIVGMAPTPMVDAVRPLMAATVAVFWTFCAWLVPLLVGAGVWRHLVHRVPLRYEAALWSMAFPLGMFAVASIAMGRTDALPMVEQIGQVALIVAVVAWALVFVGMLQRIGSVLWRTLGFRA